MMARFFRWIFMLLAMAALLAGAVAGWAYWQSSQTLKPVATPLDFQIAPGSSARSVGQQLARQGTGVQPDLFYWVARLRGEATQLKAGSYELSPNETTLSLLAKLTRGDQTTVSLTIVEGWTFKQMRAALAAHQHLKQDSRSLNETAIMAQLGLAGQAPEGWFYPDTYVFARGTSDWDVLRRAHRSMQKRLTEVWTERDPASPLKTPYEALTLASIIEKETGAAKERPLIGGVFNNRLRIGMMLQTDPTVIYGLGDAFDGNLRKRDLQTDTPFNTYTRAGLPPTPISLPGQASLLAAVRPASTKALYFVARGDGTSEFSETLQAHNRAVRKYQLGQ
jgi:UPF0755 protein